MTWNPASTGKCETSSRIAPINLHPLRLHTFEFSFCIDFRFIALFHALALSAQRG